MQKFSSSDFQVEPVGYIDSQWSPPPPSPHSPKQEVMSLSATVEATVLLVVNCGSSSHSQNCVSKQQESLLKADARDSARPQTVNYREHRKDFVHKAVTVGRPFSGGSAPEILSHGSYLNSNDHFPVKLICVPLCSSLAFFLASAAAAGEALSQLLTSCRIYLAGPYRVPSSQLGTTAFRSVGKVLIRSLSNMIRCCTQRRVGVQLLYLADVSSTQSRTLARLEFGVGRSSERKVGGDEWNPLTPKKDGPLFICGFGGGS